MPNKPQNKTQATQASVKDFLQGIKDDEQRKDAEELIAMMRKISRKPPVMWGSSIVGFDHYHYKYESGREGDMGAIGFSPRKSNLTIYLIEGASRHQDLLDKLGPHTIGKACLYIKHLKDVNMNVLEKILKTSYRYVMSHKMDMHRAVNRD